MADGSDDPITASTARAKAMSVAVGMAQPRVASPSAPISVTVARKTSAGTMTPPTAATTGTTALAGGVRRSPTRNSRLSSSPATKKKIARRPSPAQWPTVSSRWPHSMPTTVSRRVV